MSEIQNLDGPPGSRLARLRRQAGELGRFLRDDRCTRFFLLFLAVLNLSYVIPFLTREQHSTFYALYSNAFLLPAMMLTFQHRLSEISDPAERKFWNLLTFALAFWWATAIFYIVVPNAWWSMSADLITDCFYVLYYFTVFLALENRPNPTPGILRGKLVRRLNSLGALVLVFGLLIYFVLVPGVYNQAEYKTWVPSLYLYVALDLAICSQLAALAWKSTGARWRTLYGALAVAFLLFATTDVLECLTYAGVLHWQDGSKTDLLWTLPIIALVMAARLRHHEFPDYPQTSRLDETWVLGNVGGSLLLLAAFSFPVIHFSFYLLGMLDSATREPREVVVLICLLVVGGLAIAEHSVLRRMSADVEAQRRHAEQLRLEKEVAERANNAKSEFLANMSHEIRTPMNGILGMAGLLVNGGLTPPYDHYVKVLQSSAGSLLRIIDDILDFSKIEAGELAIESTAFSLAEALGQAVETQARAAAAKGIELRLAVGGEVPDYVTGDPLRLCQVVLNLIANGIKFTDEGYVSVEVTAEGPAATPLMVRFVVEDTGIGIPQDAQPRLFTPFSQADTSTTRKYGGTGLGLAICKRLVEAMGGRIGADSTAGGGSRFWFVVPLEPAEESAEATGVGAPPPPPSELRGHRILLAEDNTVNQLVATRQLESLGYQVEVVKNGVEALRALAGRTFDLILMDCQMPELDGFETTRRIRGQELRGEHLPIIAITAHAMQQDREKCLEAGMDDYLAKPYVAEDLAAVLSRWLPAAPRHATRPDEAASPPDTRRAPPAT